MISDIDCSCGNTSRCGGKLTQTELMMAKMDPSLTAEQYHQVMALFEDAFDAVFDESN